jgi:hypothetical protein
MLQRPLLSAPASSEILDASPRVHRNFDQPAGKITGFEAFRSNSSGVSDVSIASPVASRLSAMAYRHRKVHWLAGRLAAILAADVVGTALAGADEPDHGPAQGAPRHLIDPSGCAWRRLHAADWDGALI